MSNSTRYSPELRERAVRMAIENRSDYKSEWATFVGVSKLFGMSPETLRSWVRKAQIDSGSRPGLSSDERAKLKASSAKTRICDARMPFCRMRRFSSRLRSTVKQRGSCLHRGPKGSMGGRADLQSFAVRSQHLLRSHGPAAERSRPT